jgi:hypothetical protein
MKAKRESFKSANAANKKMLEEARAKKLAQEAKLAGKGGTVVYDTSISPEGFVSTVVIIKKKQSP